MDAETIKKSWRNLLIPFAVGLVIFIGAILFHTYGSKKPTPQTYSLFAAIFGFIFMVSPAIKMFKFWNYLKKQKK